MIPTIATAMPTALRHSQGCFSTPNHPNNSMIYATASEAEELEAAGKAAEEGLVNINTASAEELCTLPGIGASRAADIVRYREKNGVFQTKEDIMKGSGIKQNAYDKLCDRITVQ